MQKLQNNVLNVLFDNVSVAFQKVNGKKKMPLYLDLDCPLPENDVSVELGVFFFPQEVSIKIQEPQQEGHAGLNFLLPQDQRHGVCNTDIDKLEAAVEGLGDWCSTPELR